MAHRLLNRVKHLERSQHAQRLRLHEENEPPMWIIRQRMLQDDECMELVDKVRDAVCIKDTTGQDTDMDEVDERLERRIAELIDIEKHRMAELGDRYDPDLFWKRYSSSGNERE